MRITAAYNTFIEKMTRLNDLPLLALRLIMAYGFYNPAMMKIKDVGSIAAWFDSMGMPMPALNAYLATYTEFFGFILLFLGLGTRIITVPLMITMIVAIVTVHTGNGFEASDNGFEIPLYYLLILFTLFVYGSGKISADHLITKFRKK
jgi:putative oxidoreductase